MQCTAVKNTVFQDLGRYKHRHNKSSDIKKAIWEQMAFWVHRNAYFISSTKALAALDWVRPGCQTMPN